MIKKMMIAGLLIWGGSLWAVAQTRMTIAQLFENAHHGNRIGPHDEKIASRHYQRRIQQKLAVGKMELHLEEEGEWHRHAHHVEHDDHEHVFSHQTVLAHYLAHGSSINSARHQEDEGEEEINPRLQPAR